MATSKDNNTKKGRPKSIPTPDDMLKHFKDYREHVKNNPRYVVEQKKGSTSIKLYGNANPTELKEEITEAAKPFVYLPCQVPLTMEGFENFLFENGIITDVSDYFENKEGRYSDFVPVCSRIRKIIRQDQIEGGMLGMYNPSITQRLNNLVERKDVTTDGKAIKEPQPATINIIAPNKKDV